MDITEAKDITGAEDSTEAKGAPTPAGASRAGHERRTLVDRWRGFEGGWPSRLALAAPIVLIAFLAWLLRWMSDDGWINVRILQQLMAGNGPVFNAGERVEAGTSTLWLALVALLHLISPGNDYGTLTVYLGIVLTTAAVTLATLAGIRVARRSQPDLAGFLPFGTIVIVALPPFWDFATSGLETSLNFFWMALCYWLLVRRMPAKGEAAKSAWWPLWPSIVIGLGWLVRPDAALYAAAFAVALLVQSRLGIISWLGSLLLAILLPGAYQVFRMGYFAALVPNTALAKDASGAKWEQGIYYLLDYVIPYSIWFPILLGFVLVVAPVGRWARDRDWRTLVTVLSPIVPAFLHAFYIVRVGGDFMHARFLLPATFALMLPVAVIGLRRGQQWGVAAVAVMLGWAIAVASGARVPYTSTIDIMTDDYAGTPVRVGVANERAFYHQGTPGHTSQRIKDWRGARITDDGQWAATDLALGRSYYRDETLMPWLMSSSTPDELAIIAKELKRREKDPFARKDGYLFDTASGTGVYLVGNNMGIKSIYAGNGVHLVDRHALTDAVTAKAKPTNPQIARMGHRPMNPSWAVARYADLGRLANRHVIDAQVTLQCGDLPDLIRATTEPMTWTRFKENFALAPRLTFFTFPEEPTQARDELCGWAPPVVPR